MPDDRRALRVIHGGGVQREFRARRKGKFAPCTCVVCEKRDGTDSWGAIEVVKPMTNGRTIDTKTKVLACARCFQVGVLTILEAKT